MSSSPSHILESLPLQGHPSLFAMSLEPILAEQFRIEIQLHHMHVMLLSEQLFDTLVSAETNSNFLYSNNNYCLLNQQII